MLETQAEPASAVSSAAHSVANDVCGLMDRELGRAHRVASASVQPEDMSWLCKGFSAFLASGGKLSLERCLRLPVNERELQRAQRDYWLRAAWQLLDPAVSDWRRSELLADEVRRFLTGKWARWSRLGCLPGGASALDQALFEAFRAHERVPSTAMQLHNIACRSRRGWGSGSRVGATRNEDQATLGQ